MLIFKTKHCLNDFYVNCETKNIKKFAPLLSKNMYRVYQKNFFSKADFRKLAAISRLIFSFN